MHYPDDVDEPEGNAREGTEFDIDHRHGAWVDENMRDVLGRFREETDASEMEALGALTAWLDAQRFDLLCEMVGRERAALAMTQLEMQGMTETPVFAPPRTALSEMGGPAGAGVDIGDAPPGTGVAPGDVDIEELAERLGVDTDDPNVEVMSVDMAENPDLGQALLRTIRDLRDAQESAADDYRYDGEDDR